MTRGTRLVIVDDDEVVRTGLTAVIARERAPMQVVGAFGTAEEALSNLGRLLPDVVVLDHLLPGMNGISACREIARARPGVSVVILTTVTEDSVIHACLAAGARGFLLKDSPAEDIVDGIRAAAAGGCALAPHAVERVVDWARRARTIHDGGDSLDPHELIVLSLAAKGLKNREIARRLEVSEASAKSYLRSAMRKLGVKERTQAVAAGIRRGVI